MGNIDGKALIAVAESLGQFYPTKKSWRNLQYFAGILCCLLVLTIPLGIWIIVKARKAGVGITEEGFAFRYLTTVASSWREVESITASTMNAGTFGGGLVGVATAAAVKARTQGLKGPLNIKVKGKRFPLAIPAHTIEDSLHMATEMERLSGMPFLPAELKQI